MNNIPGIFGAKFWTPFWSAGLELVCDTGGTKDDEVGIKGCGWTYEIDTEVFRH